MIVGRFKCYVNKCYVMGSPPQTCMHRIKRAPHCAVLDLLCCGVMFTGLPLSHSIYYTPPWWSDLVTDGLCGNFIGKNPVLPFNLQEQEMWAWLL